MPAYNAAKTLERTVRELPEIVDYKILVDDFSSDETVRVAEKLGLRVFLHGQNFGYGRNQQTCYREALCRRRRHRGYGASGLSIHTATRHRDV